MFMAMDQKGLRTGHFLALLGALLSVGSLWRPWYTLDVPPQLRDMVDRLASGFGTALPGTVSASGWRELEGADVAVAVAAFAVVALVVGAAGALSAVRVDPGACGGPIALAGAAIVVVAVAHVVSKPGGAQAADMIHVADGLWLALAGGGATLAGGLWAMAEPDARTTTTAAAMQPLAFPPLTPDLPPVFAESPAAAAGSVAPPS